MIGLMQFNTELCGKCDTWGELLMIYEAIMTQPCRTTI